MAEVQPATAGAPVNWEQLFAQQQEVTRQMLDRHQELAQLLHRLEEPASIEPVQLSAASPVQESSTVPGTLSIGLLNPVGSANSVALGVFGSAGASDAIQVQAGHLLVLPIRVGVVEVAAVGAIAGGVTLYAYLLRFKSVQAARYG